MKKGKTFVWKGQSSVWVYTWMRREDTEQNNEEKTVDAEWAAFARVLKMKG